ncbi:MAG: CusA/CzcA family heavy metal efflux RND transporter [bacterium]
MIKKLITASLRQSGIVILGAIVLLGAGLWSATRLPIDAVPDITNTQVQINSEVKGLAPEEIEKLVTYPLELVMFGVPQLTELRSLSKTGLSQLTLVFQDGTDIYRARQLISERLQNATETLPPGITPKIAPITTGLGEIYYYVVDYAEGYKGADKPASRGGQLMELKLVHDFIVKPELRSVPGIAEVNASGGYEKQIVVLPSPQKLTALGLTFNELAQAIGENVENAGGGSIQVGGEQISVRSNGRVGSVEEIGDLPVRFRPGAEPLRVRDIAEVAVGTNLRTGSATHNGKESVLGSALMMAGENSRVVADRVAERLEEVRKKLPPGIEITTVYDRKDLVNTTIATVEKNLFEGAVLVMVVLLLLLGNWRAALIVSLAIPLSFLFATMGMLATGVSGNLMSLGAVDFGLIIDGAVVMVENIVRRIGLRQRELGRVLTREEQVRTVRSAANDVSKPTFFGVLIITIVYIPLLSLTGVEGKMFKPMALTVIYALVGSLLLSLTLMPVLCSLLLRDKVDEEENIVIKRLKGLYSVTLLSAINHGWKVIGGVVLLFVLSVLVFGRMGAEFIPQLDEGSLSSQMIRANSIALDASVAMQERAEKLLLEKFPGITGIFSRIGTSEVATDPMGVNVSDTYIFYKPFEQWPKVDGKAMTKDDLSNLLSEGLERSSPGQVALFSQPIEMRFNEILEGVRADVAVKVFGEDLGELEKLATEVREILEKVPGAAEVEVDAMGKAPLLEISPNRKAMARFGVQSDEINAAVRGALAGGNPGVIIDGNKRYPIMVRMPEKLRSRIQEIRRIPLRTSDGGLVTLADVADINTQEKVNSISREMGQRRLAIMVNLRGRDVESFVREAQKKIHDQVNIPSGYSIEFGGQFKNLQEARMRLMLIVPAALLIVFLLVFMAFGSLRQAFMIYSGIPLAITGGIFAIWFRGMPFSISAAVGFIALSGVAVLNGLMLISYYNQLRDEGKGLLDAVIEGSLTRLRPVMMTALVASLGFVPMALGSGAGAEVQRPLATVVIGGIITSTLLTLIVLPLIYLMVERRFGRRS